MKTQRHLFLVGAVVSFLVLGLPVTGMAQSTPSTSEDSSTTVATKEAPYVPTPEHVVLYMLDLADVTSDDVVYDLGSGDGRFVIAAAEEFGARGVGIEIDPELVERARTNAMQAGVENRVEFRQGDLFEAEIEEATVVTLYLWPTMNERLRPKLRHDLAPGSRVVSHDFDIPRWMPDTTISIGHNTLQQTKTQIHLWTVGE